MPVVADTDTCSAFVALIQRLGVDLVTTGFDDKATFRAADATCTLGYLIVQIAHTAIHTAPMQPLKDGLWANQFYEKFDFAGLTSSIDEGSTLWITVPFAYTPHKSTVERDRAAVEAVATDFVKTSNTRHTAEIGGIGEVKFSILPREFYGAIELVRYLEDDKLAQTEITRRVKEQLPQKLSNLAQWPDNYRVLLLELYAPQYNASPGALEHEAAVAMKAIDEAWWPDEIWVCQWDRDGFEANCCWLRCLAPFDGIRRGNLTDGRAVRRHVCFGRNADLPREQYLSISRSLFPQEFPAFENSWKSASCRVASEHRVLAERIGAQL